MEKPILYNGYMIEPNVYVMNRIAFELGTDIYRLSDGRFLYLFRLFKFEEIKNRQNEFKLLSTGREEYPIIIRDKYSRSLLQNIQSELIELRGFDCVAGMSALKNALMADIIHPLKFPERYKRFRIELPNGMLLFGPPGCGKTFIVRKLAEELNYTFIEIKHSDIASPYIHGTVSKIGDTFCLAREKAPSIVFIDEIEGIVPKRDRLGEGREYKQEEVNELLMQLNDVGKQRVLVVTATNRPQLIDEAFLRAGRMDRLIYVPPPDKEARIELFKMFLNSRPIASLEYEVLADNTENYASVDIEYIANQAAREALVANYDYITQEGVLKIIKATPSSITREELSKYTHFISKQRLST